MTGGGGDNTMRRMHYIAWSGQTLSLINKRMISKGLEQLGVLRRSSRGLGRLAFAMSLEDTKRLHSMIDHHHVGLSKCPRGKAA